MIIGEHKFKRQKNGNVHKYTYYRCTKKRKDMKCSESAVREKEMSRQLSSLIKKSFFTQRLGGRIDSFCRRGL